MSAPREPSPTPRARIAPLATLPLFHKIAGKRCVVAGDGEGAVWKAELLAAAGAHVLALAPNHPERYAVLAADPPAGRVEVQARDWSPEDLMGAALAIADVEEEWEARTFAARARRAGAVVNVIDKPEFCDVQFGSLVNRSPLVVAISTDGAAPVFGQAIRAKIEAMLPAGLKLWAQAAKDWRPHVQAKGLGAAARRAFWERFTALAFGASERAPEPSDREAMTAALDRLEAAPPLGRVTLVGAGPGDPELLTLKALRALQSADVILHDELVSPQVLELARREARRMAVGKVGHGPSCKQSEICELMVSLARQGLRVARLKGGDPLIFGRAGEEIAACRQAGVAVDVIPGVSAAQGAAAALGFSLTERFDARRVQFLTGHGADGKLPADLCWAAIADSKATSVLYMPRRTLAEFAARAMAAGLSPQTPALAISNATRADQSVVASTLAGLAEAADELPADAPSLVIVGSVAARAEATARAQEIVVAA
jgi:uroporphyrin-III C-methyltransferase/precorrin-2 dehydrogenase/sirohydrochlorin ferrochelatase